MCLSVLASEKASLFLPATANCNGKSNGVLARWLTSELMLARSARSGKFSLSFCKVFFSKVLFKSCTKIRIKATLSTGRPTKHWNSVRLLAFDWYTFFGVCRPEWPADLGCLMHHLTDGRRPAAPRALSLIHTLKFELNAFLKSKNSIKSARSYFWKKMCECKQITHGSARFEMIALLSEYPVQRISGISPLNITDGSLLSAPDLWPVWMWNSFRDNQPERIGSPPEKESG